MNPQAPQQPSQPGGYAPAPQQYGPQPQAQPPYQQYQPPQTPKKSHKKLWLILGLVGGLILLGLLALGAFLVYLFFFSTNFKAGTTSDAFMHYLSVGDITSANKLTEDNNAESAAFLKAYSDDVKGEKYNIGDSTKQGDMYYILFKTTDAEHVYTRVTLINNDGELKVRSFVYSKTQLSLVPSQSSDTESTAPSASSPTTEPVTTTVTCATASDYTSVFGADALGDQTYWKPGDPYITGTYFVADSLEYDDLSVQHTFTNYAAFYKANPNKKYTIHLEGSVATTAQADLAFATQRAEKVKAALVAAGISDAKIVVDTPINVTNSYGSSSSAYLQATRRVNLVIQPDSDC